MSKIVWLPEALQDMVRLRNFLEDKSPAASIRVSAIIRKGAKFLADFPLIGKNMATDTAMRELFLPFGAGNYVMRYKIQQETVVIIRIWHSKENR